MSSRGDWVVQPETWFPPQTEADQMYYMSNGEGWGLPLTVGAEWLDSAGDLQERFRELQSAEMAVATRGDIFFHLVPLDGETWEALLTRPFTFSVIARITRWTQTPGVQANPEVPLDWDLRAPDYANDQYVWQQMVEFTNVYDDTLFANHRVQPTRLTAHMRVNARYKRTIKGQDNMYLFTHMANFHSTTAWNWQVPFSNPQGRIAVTPRLRTFLTG